MIMSKNKNKTGSGRDQFSEHQTDRAAEFESAEAARLNEGLNNALGIFSGSSDDSERQEQTLNRTERYGDYFSGTLSAVDSRTEESVSAGENIRILSQHEGDGKAWKMRRRHPVLRFFAVFILILLLAAGVLLGTALYLRQRGRGILLENRDGEELQIAAPPEAQVFEGGRLVTYKGQNYRRNEKIVSILCMGVDRDEETIAKADTLKAGEQGQADTIMVAALDTETGDLNVINISRDSMTDVDLYNTDGEYAGVEQMQICLAYAYGDGALLSCENMAKSVSRLLYGIPIDAYASIGIPAISVLNDAVGGVTVDVLEDFSERDLVMFKGARVTLNGRQAAMYVRSRSHSTPDANSLRMARQRQYITAFLQQVQKRARQNLSVVLSLYQALQTYMITSLDLSQTAYLASIALLKDITPGSMITVPGTAEQKGEYAEFYVDEDALYQIILDVYYEKTDEEGNPLMKTETELPQTEEYQTEVTTEALINVDDLGSAGLSSLEAGQDAVEKAAGALTRPGSTYKIDSGEDGQTILIDPGVLH